MSNFKNILFIQPPFPPFPLVKSKNFFRRRIASIFPFGLGYLASFLEKKEYNIQILDFHALRSGLTEEKVVRELKSRFYDVIGISALINQYSSVKWLVKTIKSISNVPIILGGGLATASHKTILQSIPEIDVCVRGEGEFTMLEILKNYPDLSFIKGVSYRARNGEIIVNPDRMPYPQIDELPYPAYHLVDMSLYLHTPLMETGRLNIRRKYWGRKVMGMITARGCPYNCNFCSRIIKPGVRLRSVTNIIDEIKFLKANYGIEGVHFLDELLTADRKRVLGLCDALESLDLFWDCQGRINLVDYEILSRMKKAGCVTIGYGIESGSQKILDAMNKKITPQQIEEVMLLTEKVGLRAKAQLIFGYPGETHETVKETIDLFKRIHNIGRPPNILCPFPDTQVYNWARSKGLIKMDEEQYLEAIYEMYSAKKKRIVNLTEFKDEEFDKIVKWYTASMENNYFKHLLIHPPKLIKIIIQYPAIILFMINNLLEYATKKHPLAYSAFFKIREFAKNYLKL